MMGTRQVVTFSVKGVPAPQGSKTPWGSEANPRTKPWRALVAHEAAEAMGDRPLTSGPVAVRAIFYFPRPKRHFRTGKHADELRDDAPAIHSGKPDIDKLLRAVLDAMTGIVFSDDSRVYNIEGTKLYSDAPGVFIDVRGVK